MKCSEVQSMLHASYCTEVTLKRAIQPDHNFVTNLMFSRCHLSQSLKDKSLKELCVCYTCHRGLL